MSFGVMCKTVVADLYTLYDIDTNVNVKCTRRPMCTVQSYT